MWGIKDTTGEHQNWFAGLTFPTQELAQAHADSLNEDEERRNATV